MTERASGGPHEEKPEIWGGVECTVNRVGDEYFDQLELSGHASRPEDLERFRELGIRTLRYPALWERVAPEGVGRAEWSWLDGRMARLDRLGFSPILGLLHHGSGPRSTHLLDPSFPEGLAAYAAAVAARYPWVTRYTPVNEPLTTARFSLLYGHWYPHARDAAAFARGLVLQCRAVVEAMGAIRRVIPGAELVQTEDLGRIFSTPHLRYQAEFENHRRFLSLDLLCGRVDASHPLRDYLLWLGVEERELSFFLKHPCPPSVVGVNYYLTSDRFLDERVELYPPSARGGNDRERYADVAAVRVCADGVVDPYSRLKEVWERYRIPVAVTETHLGCTREEQLRWLLDVWEAACALKRDGADIRAVTSWSLLGAYEWNSLVTRREGHYESGAFCLRSPIPRPTALATALRRLAAGACPELPAADGPGWWRRPERLILPGRPVVPDDAPPRRRRSVRRARPVVIVGATGTLGRAFARLCEVRGLAYHLVGRQQMDIALRDSVESLLRDVTPWAVINAAGYVRVDDAEREPERCHRENVLGAVTLAAACVARNLPLVTFSSDLVFDGLSRHPYVESANVAPLNVYGRSKAEAEARVLGLHPGALVVRTGAFFGPWDEHNFVAHCLRRLRGGEGVSAANNAIVSPTYVPHLADACLDLLIDGEKGIWHLANRGEVSWAELAREVASRAGFHETSVLSPPETADGTPARRPEYSALTSRRGLLLPPLEVGLSAYFAAVGA